MKTTHDLLLMCCNEYLDQLERWNTWIELYVPCTLCAMAYDYIARGDY